MRKLLLFTFVVALPAIAVGISNWYVFPDAFLLATILLAVTVGVAAIFTWQSGNATSRVSKYCIVADVIICVILCVNLGSHWILAREVSGATQGTVERHAEEDREDRRKTADAERQLALKKADADLAKADADRAKANAGVIEAERRRLNALPVSQRRSQMQITAPTAQPTTASSTEPIIPSLPVGVAAEAKPAVAQPKLTAEQVRERWWWFLTALAFAECFASVLSGAVLAGVWEWDRNRDGIADHQQAGVKLNYQGERTYRILPDGSREIIESTYSPDEVGRVVPADKATPPQLRRPLVRPSSPQHENKGAPKANGVDAKHIGSAGALD